MAEDSRKKIVIKGAREHNLQDIDVTVPRDEFIVSLNTVLLMTFLS